MKKICHLTSAHESDDDRIFQKECASLARAGYDTYLVARGESREEKGVHVVGLGEAPASRLKRMTSFTKKVYMKALKIDADIYHLHDPELLPWGVKLKKHGKKVIFDSHENYPTQILNKKFLPAFLRNLVSELYRRIETNAVAAFDTVIVPCTFDGTDIFQKRAKKSVLIANYPVLSAFYEAYQPQHEKKYDICYAGGLSYQRGIYHLIKAAGSAGARLALAGNFVDSDFENRVKSMEEYSNVAYLGSLSSEEVAELLQSSRIGANTLLNEGQYHHMDTFGVKVYEYMSMGIPVITFDCAYANSINGKYNFGLCTDPENIQETAEAINRLLKNPEESKQMGLNGRRAVEQEFNWSTQEKKLLTLYKDILNEM